MAARYSGSYAALTLAWSSAWRCASQNSLPSRMRLSVTNIGRYSYQGLAFSAGRSIASMMAGWLFAARKQLAQPSFLIESVVGYLVYEFLDLRAVDVDRERRHSRHAGHAQEQEYGFPRMLGVHHDPMSLRCECSDMRMPKPASRVTMEVPP